MLIWFHLFFEVKKSYTYFLSIWWRQLWKLAFITQSQSVFHQIKNDYIINLKPKGKKTTYLTMHEESSVRLRESCSCEVGILKFLCGTKFPSHINPPWTFPTLDDGRAGLIVLVLGKDSFLCVSSRNSVLTTVDFSCSLWKLQDKCLVCHFVHLLMVYL